MNDRLRNRPLVDCHSYMPSQNRLHLVHRHVSPLPRSGTNWFVPEPMMLPLGDFACGSPVGADSVRNYERRAGDEPAQRRY
jgi:hypothetical protein